MNAALAATGIYIALNFMIFAWLANETGKVRRREKIALGDGGNKHLARMMRGTANATENIPMFLIALVVGALIGMPVIAVHIIGMTFTIGRAVHASYFIQPNTPMMRRFVGFGIALLAQTILMVGLLAHGIYALFAHGYS